MTERISDAIFLTQYEKRNNTVITVPDLTGALSRTRPPDYKEAVSCPQYQEIRGYPLKNRNELALDTMKFAMPDHIFLAHIQNNGALDISYDEWMAFLITAHRATILLLHVLLSSICHRY